MELQAQPKGNSGPALHALIGLSQEENTRVETLRARSGILAVTHPTAPSCFIVKRNRSAVIPVQTGIHIGCFKAKTVLDSESHPKGLARNGD